MSVFNDDVLCIHPPKAAGTSVRDYCARHLLNLVDSIGPGGGPFPIDSVPLRHVEQYSGRPLDSWERILIPIRNPYAHAVSHWTYHADRFAKGGRHVHDLTAALHKTLTDWLVDPLSDFRLWYETSVRGESHADAARICDETGFFEYYATVDGVVPPNAVLIPTEEIGARFPLLLAPYHDGPPTEFPHTHKSGHRADRTMSYYSALALTVVHHRYRWLFERGYYQRVGEAAA